MVDTILDRLEKHELKEFHVKCWMTHDAALFYNFGRMFGVETDNKLNKVAAILTTTAKL